MPRVGLKPTIPVFEQVRAVHALDSAATVIGHYSIVWLYLLLEIDSLIQTKKTKQTN
jgi:hypothetical protein